MRRLHEGLAQRQQRDLHREAAGLPDAALDVFGAQAEMRVAGVGVAPRVEDGDDRLAGHVVGAEAGLLARASGGRTIADRPCRTSGGCADLSGCLARAAHASRSAERARDRRELVELRPASSGETNGGIGPVGAMPASSVA